MLADIYGKSREQKWVRDHRDTHMTAPQIAARWTLDIKTVRKQLGHPDLRYLTGNRTGLYKKERVMTVFGGSNGS